MGSSEPSVRVSHLIASEFAGGPEKQIVELSKQLQRHGWLVSIGSFLEGRESVELLSKASDSGLDTFEIRTSVPWSIGAVSQLRSALHSRGTQLLVTHGYKADMVGKLATIATRTRQLPVVRGYTAADGRLRLYEALDRRLLRRFPHVVAVSSSTRAMLIAEGIRKEKVATLKNAVRCDLSVTPADLRSEFSLATEDTIAVTVGRLSPEKGHSDLIDALEMLSSRRVPIHLIVVGSGPEAAKLKRQVEQLGVSAAVTFAGFRQDAIGLIAGADILVNPSHTEGLPNVVLEAMSVGTAVVATSVGGVPELVHPNRTGWLVPSRSPESLADALEIAVAQSDRRSEYARAALDLVRREFSFSGQALKFMELARHVISGTAD